VTSGKWRMGRVPHNGQVGIRLLGNTSTEDTLPSVACINRVSLVELANAEEVEEIVWDHPNAAHAQTWRVTRNARA
jgi:hypothetical protein